MRILLDTNIIIHREAATIFNRDIGVLFNWLDKLHYSKCVHPTSIEEIKKHKDPKVVSTMAIKIANYHALKTEATLSPEVQEISRKYDINENDINDTKILNEVYADRVDFLITEDRKIHKKSNELGIPDRIFTIDSFLEKVNAENPSLTDYKVLSVTKEYFGKINIADSFFDSFREDYQGFDTWFNRKADEIAYVCKSESGQILAFLFLKVEGKEENYSDINPIFPKKKRLKIGTFKVTMNGFKLGERFLKIIFDNAIRSQVEEIYVTIFPKRLEQQRLIQLLKDWGFSNYGEKQTPTGIELVFNRDFSKNVNKSAPKITYPYITKDTNFFIVPIYPDYHTELFPDSILRTESPNDFIENEPHRNAISKVYLSRSYNRNLKSGDIIVFYRTGGIYQGVVSTIGIIENIITKIDNEEHLILLCRKRSVFSDTGLKEFWNFNPRSRPFIVNFLYVYSLPKRINLKSLIDLQVIVGVDSVPRGFERISQEQFESILKASNSDESFIVN